MMKKFYFSIALLSAMAVGASMTGCSNDEIPEEPTVKGTRLAIKAELEKTQDETKAPMTVWANGNEMGLFVKSSGLTGSDYGEVNGQVKATYNGSAWTLDPQVSLSSTPAYVFAYYPYSNTVTDGTSVPVEVASQTDYLYSGTAVNASSNNASISLTMKHALCVFQFNVKKDGYIGGSAVLTSVKIQNKGGYTLVGSAGTLNISTGVITKSAYEAFTLTSNKTITEAGWDNDRPLAMLMPFQTASTTGAEFVFTVDGKDYTIDVPANMNYLAGNQYVFNLTIKSGSMSLDSSNIQIVPWGNETNVDLGDQVTKVKGLAYTLTTTTAGQSHNAPNVGNLSGTIDWGDNSAQDSYASGKSHNVAAAGKYNVQLQAEDEVNQVEFSQIELIDEIDLSQIG